MQPLRRVLRKLTELVRQIFTLPTFFRNAAAKHRQQQAAAKQEAERIDRIRNPSKYLGV
ncbi:MAG: hypothetical protein JNN07_01640 [Verrucomicrobiales bacterium]|nr:hypothetical protein [Verrucomicrobiales bacterium]